MILILTEQIKILNQVAEKVFLSSSHGNLLFKNETGQTIFDFLVQTRMDIAKELLKDPHIKIYEIPEKVGYKANAHFRNLFKNYVGMTPVQYKDKKTKGGV